MQPNYNATAEPYEGGGSKGEDRRRTVPVDSFEVNPRGLYNVHGNVWECTEDCWNDSNTGKPGDGARVIEHVARIRIYLPTSCPERAVFRMIALSLMPAVP